jgi:anaerobic magnesium-protoporphyrin IX monomethyl ester cyclase
VKLFLVNMSLGESALQPLLSVSLRALSFFQKASARPFRLAFTFYQWDATYSLAVAALSAYAKREIPNIEVSLFVVSKGDSIEAYRQQLAAFKPDLIAVSAMHPTWLPLRPYLESVKAAMPKVRVIVGGYQAIFSPEATLGHPAVDFVCVGDGEEPLVDVIRRVQGVSKPEQSTVRTGFWEKKPNGDVLRSAPLLTPDLKRLPFPDYTIFEKNGSLRWLSPHAIESRDLTTLPVMSGRGCPYRCTYCSNTPLLDLLSSQGSILRHYDVEAFIAELVRLKQRYSAEYFQFMDETFTFDKKHAYRLMDLYKQKVGLPFSCFARVEQMDDEFCRIASRAGCHSMWFGVESGSEEYRRLHLGRKMSNRQILQASEMARRHGIKRMTFNMVGMPLETREDVLQTFELIKAIQPELVIVGQYLPLPGTPLYAVAEKAGLLLEATETQQMWTIGTLNISEQPGGVTAGELKQLVDEIMQYLWQHNRYDEGPSWVRSSPREQHA